MWENLPLIISDANQLHKVESISNGSFTPQRANDTLWQWHREETTFAFYAKEADDPSRLHICAFHEIVARIVADSIGVNHRPFVVLNTLEGVKLGSLIDLDFPVSLEKSERHTLRISEKEKIMNLVSHILLADANGNAGSVLVHQDKKSIARVDFERCFGYQGNGLNYDLSVTSGLGSISKGPFYEEIKNVPQTTVLSGEVVHFVEGIEKFSVVDFSKKVEGVIYTLKLFFPNCTEDLDFARDHLVRCLEYRTKNIRSLIKHALS